MLLLLLLLPVACHHDQRVSVFTVAIIYQGLKISALSPLSYKHLMFLPLGKLTIELIKSVLKFTSHHGTLTNPPFRKQMFYVRLHTLKIHGPLICVLIDVMSIKCYRSFYSFSYIRILYRLRFSVSFASERFFFFILYFPPTGCKTFIVKCRLLFYSKSALKGKILLFYIRIVTMFLNSVTFSYGCLNISGQVIFILIMNCSFYCST